MFFLFIFDQFIPKHTFLKWRDSTLIYFHCPGMREWYTDSNPILELKENVECFCFKELNYFRKTFGSPWSNNSLLNNSSIRYSCKVHFTPSPFWWLAIFFTFSRSKIYTLKDYRVRFRKTFAKFVICKKWQKFGEI